MHVMTLQRAHTGKAPCEEARRHFGQDRGIQAHASEAATASIIAPRVSRAKRPLENFYSTDPAACLTSAKPPLSVSDLTP